MLLYTTRSVSSAPSSALAELPFVLGVLVALTNLVLSKRLPRRCSSQHGAYEWLFGVGAYFAAAGVPSCGTPFLNEVPPLSPSALRGTYLARGALPLPQPRPSTQGMGVYQAHLNHEILTPIQCQRRGLSLALHIHPEHQMHPDARNSSPASI